MLNFENENFISYFVMSTDHLVKITDHFKISLENVFLIWSILHSMILTAGKCKKQRV